MSHHHTKENVAVPTPRIGAIATTLVATSLLLPACSAQKVDDAKEPSSGGHHPALYAKLPAAIRKAGVLKLGTDASAAPFASVEADNKTIVGINADLSAAAGRVLGVKVDLQNVAFDQSVPSVTTGRVDAYWDWSKDLPASRTKVDFVDFATTGAGMMVKEGNPDGVNSAGDLCGRTVAVQDGSSNVDIVNGVSQSECVAKGKKPITLLKLNSTPAALLQIKSGRASAVVTAYGVCAYQGKISKEYDLAGGVLSPVKAGVTVAKSNTELRGAIQAAIQQLIDDGTYQTIMDKWALGGSMIKTVTIDDAS